MRPGSWLLLAALIVSAVCHGYHVHSLQGTIRALEDLVAAQDQLIVEQQDLLGEVFGVAFFDSAAARSLSVTVSMYTSRRCETDSTPWQTADMSNVRPGIVAVSRDLMREHGLRFGQRIFIAGYGVYEVRDVMNPRWERRVDLWCPDLKAAKLHGVNEAVMIWLDLNG